MTGTENYKVPTPVATNVAYADLSGRHRLDIYLPAKQRKSFPLVIFVHGGGFFGGSKDVIRERPGELRGLNKLLNAGYAVSSVNYRLSSEAIWPAQIEDVKAAVRWLRAHAGTYNFNSEQFVAFGPSAGGHLSSMLGTTGDITQFDNPVLGNVGVSSCVQAVVDWFGPIDFLTIDAQFSHDAVSPKSAQTHNAHDSPGSLLLGAPIQKVPEIAHSANPMTYISEKTPSFWIEHGTVDSLIPLAQSVNFYSALVQAIGADKVTLTILPGAGHGSDEFLTDKNFDFLVTWLDSQFCLA